MGTYQRLKGVLTPKSPEGIYEILEYDGMLELKDPKGRNAVFKKRLRVKFLQDYVIAFQDHVWGDGQTMAGYRCSPGVEVDRYQEGDRWNILVSLREMKSRGDTEDYYIERRIKGGFANDEEWWQLEMYHQTDWLKCSIVFPKTRHCRRAILFEKNRNQTTILEPKQFADLPDGRQLLAWETRAAKRFETYTIKWQWWCAVLAHSGSLAQPA